MTRCLVTLFWLIATAAAHADALEELRSAIADRLVLMTDVARDKWNRAASIADPEREAALLAAKLPFATAHGLPEPYARRVLEAQLAASRLLQAELMARWTAAGHGAFPGVPDLATVQRPQIDAATDRLVEVMAASLCELTREDARGRMATVPGRLHDAGHAWSTATDALWPLPDGLDCDSALVR